jgi:hypothetical protein
MREYISYEFVRALYEEALNQRIDLNDKRNYEFLSQFTGSVLLLIPEAHAYLVTHGLQNDEETEKKVLRLIWKALIKAAS